MHSKSLLFTACRPERSVSFLNSSFAKEGAPFDSIGKYAIQNEQVKKQFLISSRVKKLHFFNFLPTYCQLLFRRYHRCYLLKGGGDWERYQNVQRLSVLLNAREIFRVEDDNTPHLVSGKERREILRDWVFKGFLTVVAFFSLFFAAILLLFLKFVRNGNEEGEGRAKKVGYFVRMGPNPYLTLLQQNIQSGGHETSFDIPLKIKWLFENQKEKQILHFQWINAHFQDRALLKEFRKSVYLIWFFIFAKIFRYRMVYTEHNLTSHDTAHPSLDYLVTFFWYPLV